MSHCLSSSARGASRVRLWCVLLLGLLLAGCTAPPVAGPDALQMKKILLLRKGDLSLGILPDAGGRVVLLSKGDVANLIDSDPRTWARQYVVPEMTKLGFEDLTPGLQGYTVWVAPQSQWWTQQDVVPAKRDWKSPWPPDPFTDGAPAEVKRGGPANDVTLVLPESPITGLQLTKRYELISATQVRVTVEAVNKRASRVTWGLWSNMRLLPEASVYLPRNTEKKVVSMTTTLAAGGSVAPLPYHFNDSWFGLDTAARPSEPWTMLQSKIYSNPSPVFVAGFVRGVVLVRRLESAEQDRLSPEQQRLAPEHARVEIFGQRGKTSADDLLEVELHGPVVDLQPGQTLRFVETWQIESCPGVLKQDDQMKYLDQITLPKPKS